MTTQARQKLINLECTYCHTETPLYAFKGECPNCGEKIMKPRYEMEGFDVQAWLKEIRNRPETLWRYHELLPIYDTNNIVTMGEGGTPLIKSRALAASLGLKHLYIKDERQGPTGSFKDRQATVAISTLVEMDVDEVVVASTGNVAIAYAAYGARAGIKLWGFFPKLTPSEKMREAALYGAEIIGTTGTYDQTKALAASFAENKGIFLDKGIKSVAATEGMKTMAYEIAEQLGNELEDGQRWRSPDWYLQGVSGGLGPIGIGNGFEEMHEFGLIDKMPAFGMIQSSGCAPMVEAFNRGQRVATPLETSGSVIVTLATGNPGRAYEILFDYVQEHGGHFEAATDEEAFNAIRILARHDGISVEPATGVTFAGLFKMVRQGIIKPDDVVVVNASGHTLPVEKRILGERWQNQVDMSNAARSHTVPTAELSSAVRRMGDDFRRVVVIEDNEAAARLMVRILKARENSEVYLADNGASGLTLIREKRPDLVITDLMMPDVDGFSVIESMKSDNTLQQIPIVVVTAKELTIQERDYLSTHTEMVLQKGSFIDEAMIESLMQRLN
ncbi:pyridoxal-phosphate dependent enzyme [Phototrophicus methaneseepsis]|uniref:Pyridoxal-phosphate dependent enzyme n=1 Tax=Phototrophicus methaneseepsis TaxID=2710758 RepID=A0A7S8E8P6_9CHLR|nr:pyridoxal-phosphate dependent enzyme [Phototrophicus methaneseepsis]QPC82397.1 pyridoxal-phosphate dependent enzyme [Phototrophicus methaneseepsis]